jgi:GNAT superfamily N-acetyltransferase
VDTGSGGSRDAADATRGRGPADTQQREVTTWHLEMLDPGWLRPVARPDERLAVVHVGIASPELNRFLYTAVGAGWFWTDRLGWTYAAWQAYVEQPEVETWVAWLDGTPAGYFELEPQAEGSVEIAYIGLLPQFTGRRIGAYLLSVATVRAWSLQEPTTRRVWLHTCSLDSPIALKNYQSRGFRLFKTETQTVTLPAMSPGPWPGAVQVT